VKSDSAYPEFLSRKDMDSGPWQIRAGQPIRGDAWTDISAREMRVPIGDDEVYRVIRAHEMVHAKISPAHIYTDGRYSAPTECVIAAEELRVNTCVRMAGFDTNLLSDGSEMRTGALLARTDNWQRALLFGAAIAGTQAFQDFVDGATTERPEWETLLRLVEYKLLNYLSDIPQEELTNTEADRYMYQNDDESEEDHEVHHPYGFRHTVQMAHMLSGMMGRTGDEVLPGRLPTAEEISSPRRGGKFADLVLAQLPLIGTAKGDMGRRKKRTDVGVEPRYVERLLDDPSKRIFSRKQRARGGVVLIDQSGSMHLNHDEILEILDAAPGATVIGYSHYPGSTDIPNTWILAKNGRVVAREELPDGNGGNGVDGPALRFAASMRNHKQDPFIWVCDGYVTDGQGDCAYENLNREAADLAKAFGVHMVEDVEGAIEVLDQVKKGRFLPTKLIGSVGQDHEEHDDE
jgi:hypothetical protein